MSMRWLPLALALTAKDCASIKPPVEPGSTEEMFTVRFSEDQQSCTVECDAHRPGTNVTFLNCVAFPDIAISLERALPTNCTHTIVEAPDKAPGTTDPEMSVVSCADFFVYSGWDRGQKRVL